MAVLEGDGLLEREHELAVLDAALDGAVAGAGRVVVIEGQAGIGKTRLLAAALDTAAARRIAAVRARGSDLEREFAFGVVRQLFERVLARAGGGREALLGGAAAHAAFVLAAPERTVGAAGPAPSMPALEHGLFWLVANIADRRPLLVVVDDAQWSDEASLGFLHYLARRADELPVALVLATRRAGDGGGAELLTRIAGEPEATVLGLRPLSAEAAREVVRALVSQDADERVCEACYAATGGNPLLLRELAGALHDNGVPTSPAELDRVGRLVPEAVARHVLIRLARRPPAAAALARAAAVLGDGAQPRHAAALAGLDETVAAEAIDALVAADILAPGRALEFVHPLLREVVYAELAPGERGLAHRRAARLLADAGADSERTALQLLACEPAGAEWAVQALRAAARDAVARGAAQSAVRYLARALSERPSPGLLASVLTELGLAEATAALPGAPDHLAHALRLTADPIHRARVAPELAVALEHSGRPVDAVAVLERAIDELEDGDLELSVSLQAQAVVVANTYLAARRALLPRVARARVELPRLGSPVMRPLLAALAHELAHRGGTAEQAAAYAERSLAGSARMESVWDAILVIVAAEALRRCGRLSRAEGVLDALVAAARAHGQTHSESSALTARARTLNHSGRLLEAEAGECPRICVGMSELERHVYENRENAQQERG